ncbi:MAG: gliding motility-associated C-terminal domain-containing protein, partial [Chlorobi bacterium]|nr:gliding motility-associated C-terminal domain-containing protein [Chlorobiota bacterium]
HFYPVASEYTIELLVHHCGTSDTITQKVDIKKPPVVSLGNDTTICSSCSITLNGGNGMDDWLWQDGSRSQYYEVQNAGTYSVTVWKNGCTVSDTINISRGTVNVYMPNAFTPNGDGINDVFKPVTSEPLQGYHLTIFNRRGVVLFESSDYEQGWDGRFKGTLQPNQVYCWKVVYTISANNDIENIEKKGTVLLVR